MSREPSRRRPQYGPVPRGRGRGRERRVAMRRTHKHAAPTRHLHVHARWSRRPARDAPQLPVVLEQPPCRRNPSLPRRYRPCHANPAPISLDTRDRSRVGAAISSRKAAWTVEAVCGRPATPGLRTGARIQLSSVRRSRGYAVRGVSTEIRRALACCWLTSGNVNGPVGRMSWFPGV